MIPSWTETFMAQCEIISRRSKDPSTKHGAIIADKRHRVIAQGFNGPPSSVADANVPFHDRPAKYGWIIHAEMNAILFGLAARGIDGLRGADLYVTGKPCSRCMLLIVHVGIGCVYYGERTAKCTDEADWKLTQEIARAGGTMLPAVVNGGRS